MNNRSSVVVLGGGDNYHTPPVNALLAAPIPGLTTFVFYPGLRGWNDGGEMMHVYVPVVVRSPQDYMRRGATAAPAVGAGGTTPKIITGRV